MRSKLLALMGRSWCCSVVATGVLFLSGCVSEVSTVSGNEASLGSSEATVVKSKPIDDKQRFDLRFELAAAYYSGGQYDVAMEEIDKALVIQPRSADGNLLKGMIYDRQGNSSVALDYIRKAMTYKPGDGNYIHNYGVALCVNKNYAEGIKYLQQAVAAPGYQRVANSWAAMGTCYAQAGDFVQAEGALRQALEVEPRNGFALAQLANFMYKKNDPIAARQYFNQLGPVTDLSASTLWLGIRIARKQGDALYGNQLAKLLRDNYPSSPECQALDSGDFDFE